MAQPAAQRPISPTSPTSPSSPTSPTSPASPAGPAIPASQVAEPCALLTGLPPVVGPRTRLLLLGSFPGVASLRAQQYYGHARNQFWPILSALWGVDLRAMLYAQRLDVLRAHGLGLWDVYARCRRPGSLDSAITDAQPNPLAALAATLPALAAIDPTAVSRPGR